MEEIILSLEPAFHRIERFLLWHNRYVSLVAFILIHGIFYAIARAGLRPLCAITIVLMIFHVLDCIKKKRVVNEEKNLSDLTQVVLNSYRRTIETHERLNVIKTENRSKYSLILIVICFILAYTGMKINGFYVSYIVMLILFTLPAIIYHKMIPKLLKRLAPILEQLDESMEYKRRTLVDRKDLLVKIKTPGLNENADEDDDEDVRKLKQQNKQMPIMTRSVNTSDDDGKLFSSRLSKTNSDILSDSSSSAADDDTAHIDELYANVGDKIDGKHRIKIKGDEIKIKGYSNRQRTKLTNPSQIIKKNSLGEPDLSSFDFLNDYDQQ
ncbi:unnamed protein product [Adineta ricciae]|uniref:RETREG1-3/ARL6IP-like N-terminal reticulon-homology domain-containing protein n=1 Tax=Adineta ricciae TaxID=249248 RepID=A0A815B1M1_ADIRI|nr:unnamed protein product [Adineta ricciae]CAF1261789.1 unnamed protein product [Adineta ricciae]